MGGSSQMNGWSKYCSQAPSIMTPFIRDDWVTRFCVFDMHKKRAKAQKLRKFVTMCPLGTAREQTRSPLFARDTPWARYPAYEKKSELALASEGRGGHEHQLAEAPVGHAAEEPLIQPGGLAGSRHDGWQLGVIAIVDQLVELLTRPGGG